MRFVGNEHAGRYAGFSQGLGNPVTASVGAEDDVHMIGVLPVAYPRCDFRRVSGDLALHLGGVDVAVVQRWVSGGVPRAFLKLVYAASGATLPDPDGIPEMALVTGGCKC